MRAGRNVRRSVGASLSGGQGRPHVGAAEIVADKEQGTIQFDRQRIGEAVAEIQAGRVNSLAPPGMGSRNTVSIRGADGLDYQPEFLNESGHLLRSISMGCDNESFAECSRRYSGIRFTLQNFLAGHGPRFLRKNGHERRSIDNDHLGSPVSSSYRKS